MPPEDANSISYEEVDYSYIVVGTSSLGSAAWTPDQCKQWDEITIVQPEPELN